MHHRGNGTVHTKMFATPVVEYWQVRERERNVLFNDALNIFYLWLYGVRHMVKDHSDSEKPAAAT